MAYYCVFCHNRPIPVTTSVVVDSSGSFAVHVASQVPPGTYTLHLQVVFVDSWCTATSGLHSFHLSGAAVSIRPYPYSPSVWIAWRVVLFPSQFIGLVSDTVTHTVSGEIRIDKRSPALVVQIPVAAAHHMADILSVSGYYDGYYGYITSWGIYAATLYALAHSYTSIFLYAAHHGGLWWRPSISPNDGLNDE